MLKNFRNPEFIKIVRNDKRYMPLISFVEKYYEDNKREIIPALTFSERWECYFSGNRAVSEAPYFAARKHLVGVALMSVLYPEKEEYLLELQDVLWAICDEYSWVVAAHTSGIFEEDLGYIDLFCSETAGAIAEICDLLKERLHPAVLKRCEYELRTRIIEPFMNRSYPWEPGISNWSAVCITGTAMVFYYLEPKLFGEYIDRFKESIKYFKKSFADDGTCIEGPSYWGYGFGYFTFLADMIYDYTDGKDDLLDDDKIIKMAEYFKRIFLKGDSVITFSDSDTSFKVPLGVLYYLHKRLPDKIPLFPMSKIGFTVPNIYWVSLARAFEYFDPDAAVPEDIPMKDYYLKDAGQVILNREKYSFAIKSGSNKEPHNQNDVGTFIFADKSGQVFCDLGAGKYSNQYFNNDTRYKFLCCSSLGHNVPIINGEEQKVGPQAKGYLKYEDNIITLEFSSAYGIENINKLIRTITPTKDGIILEDECENSTNFISRLVTLKKPIIDSGYVYVEDVSVKFDPQVCSVSLSTGSHEIHASDKSITVYLLDFKADSTTSKINLEITTK